MHSNQDLQASSNQVKIQQLLGVRFRFLQLLFCHFFARKVLLLRWVMDSFVIFIFINFNEFFAYKIEINPNWRFKRNQCMLKRLVRLFWKISTLRNFLLGVAIVFFLGNRFFIIFSLFSIVFNFFIGCWGTSFLFLMC